MKCKNFLCSNHGGDGCILPTYEKDIMRRCEHRKAFNRIDKSQFGGYKKSVYPEIQKAIRLYEKWQSEKQKTS